MASTHERAHHLGRHLRDTGHLDHDVARGISGYGGGIPQLSGGFAVEVAGQGDDGRLVFNPLLH